MTHDSPSGRGRALPSKLPRPGERVGDYLLEQEIARGGAGVVYRVASADGRRFALKLFLEDLSCGTRRQRFEREASIGRTLRHPGTVRVLDQGEHGGRAYLVMELLEGANPLDRYVQLHQVAPLDRVRLMMEVAQTVHAAHQVGIVHRDLKPDNVLVTADGTVKVVDFGIAKQIDRERLTHSGAIFGTLHYMAPEQAGGDTAHADARTDVYSLGVMIYHLVSGELPFDGDTAVEILAAIMERPARPLDGRAACIPRGLSDVVAVAMAKAPHDRYPDAGALAKDLAAVFADAETEASAKILVQRRSEGASRLVAILGGVALVLAAAVGAFAWQRSSVSGPGELQRLAAELEAEARSLLRSRGPLRDDAAAIRALSERAGALAGQASAPGPAREAVERALARATALDGLLALTEGDRERAERLASRGNAQQPGQAALAGALLATDPAGDAELALRSLARASSRGVDRPELHGWKARALVRRGLRSSGDGDAVLHELERLARVRGDLTPEEVCLRAWGLLAKGEPDAAAEAVGELGPVVAPKLAAAIGLARGELLLAQEKPEEALGLLREVAAGLDRERAAQLNGRVHQQLRQWLTALENSGPTGPPQGRAVALIEIASLLAPQAPLPLEVRDALLVEGTSIKRSQGLARVVIALCEAYPADVSVQREASSLAWRGLGPGEIERLLPALRRGVRLTEAGDARTRLQALLFGALVDLYLVRAPRPAELDEAWQLAARVLEAGEEEALRSEIYVRRSMLRLRLGDRARALEDADAAVAINEGDPRMLRQRIEVLRAGGEHDADLTQAIVHFAGVASGSAEHIQALQWSWALSREVGDDASARAALEALTGSRMDERPEWWVRLAQLRLRAGDRAAARDALRRGGRGARSRAGVLSNALSQIEGPLEELAAESPERAAQLDALVDALEPKGAQR